jgi:spermidine synthase
VPDWIAEADARPLEVLVIGGGAGTLRGLLRRFHPSRVARVDDVELDPLVAGLSARFGGAPQAPDRVFVADGRAVLRSEGARYDFIVLDAYARQLAVPAHLGSREAFAEAAARLTPRGVFAMNVSAAEVRSPLVQTLVRTMREAFPEVRAVPVAGSWNLLLLAGAELDVRRAVAARGDALDAARREFRRALRTLPAPDPEWRPLTDDLAPLESLARRIK